MSGPGARGALNLLYVCADEGIPLAGHKGASVHVRQTIGALAKLGVDVTVLSARPEAADVPAKVLGIPRHPDRNARGLAAELAKIARARDLLSAAEPLAAVDVVYERYSLWSLTGTALADRWKVPLVVEVNAPLVLEQQRYRRLASEELATAIETCVLRRASAVLCVSSPICEHVTAVRGTDDGVHLFPNSVDLAAFKPAQEYDATVRVAFVGSLKPWHGVDSLVRAFAMAHSRCPELRLDIIGDGPEREALASLVASLQIGDVVDFRGAIPHAEIPEALARCQVGVAPYPPIQDFYFSPLKLVEYFAAGLATISTQLGDYGRWASEGKHVVVASPGSVESLARALVELARNPAQRRALGRRARRLAEEHLGLDQSTSRLVSTIQQLIPRAHEASSGSRR